MSTKEEATNQVGNKQQVLVTIESHPVNSKLNSGADPHLDVEL